MKTSDLDVLLTEWLRRFQVEHKKKMDDEPSGSISNIELRKTSWLLGTTQIILIILFATVGGSQLIADNQTKRPGTASQGYNMFIGVEIMMFVGFGYLMAFMKWYGLGSVGWTMLVTAIGLQWSLFTESFFTQLYQTGGSEWHYVQMDIYSLLGALYALTAVLISLGAVIGKISPFQLVVMTLVELVFHPINYKILLEGCIGIVDMGGTYAEHMFGAYFGLAVAYVLGKPKENPGSTSPAVGYISDLFCLIGTVFLWVYFPSFVAAPAETDSPQQERALVNTILSLASSTICAFWLSSVLSPHSKIRPVDIQNATLAGGVAIGCTANLTISGFSAIIIGAVSGLVCCGGYNLLTPVLEIRLGLHDTCGIHNLHALPSVIGATASVILAGYKGSRGKEGTDTAIYDVDNINLQWGYQLLGVVVCIIFATVTGLITGFILKYIGQNTKPFQDDAFWEVAEDYHHNDLLAELGALPGQPGVSVDALRDADSDCTP